MAKQYVTKVDLETFKIELESKIGVLWVAHDELKRTLTHIEGKSKNDPEVAVLRGEIAKLERMLVSDQSTVAAVDSSTANPILAYQAETDLSAVDERLSHYEEVFTSQGEKLTKIDDRLKELEGTVTGHGVRITNVERDSAATANEVSDLKGSHGRLTNRVRVLERIRDAKPWGAAVIGAIIGLITYILWYNLVPWKQEITLADGSVGGEVRYEALHYGGSWFAAIAVGALVTALIIMFVRRVNDNPEYDIPNDKVRVSTPSKPVTPQQKDAEDTTPTTALPAEGVLSGAR